MPRLVRPVAFTALAAAAALHTAGVRPLGAQTPAATVAPAAATAERVDTALYARLRAEATARSQVMELASWLSDVHAPRLTGSPTTRAAAEWTMRTLQGWGVRDVRLEPWGPFGRGWSSDHFALRVAGDNPWPVLAYPSAWTPGTNGPVTGEAVLVTVDSLGDLARWAGKLRGRFVLLGAPRTLAPRFEPLATRLSDAQLAELEGRPAPAAPGMGGAPGAMNPAMQRAREAAALRTRAMRFVAEQGAAALLLPGQGDGGTVFVSGAGGSRDTAATAPMVPTAVLAAEHYGRLARTLAKGLPVTLELDARHRWHDADRASFNLVADLPGTDRRLKDEVVMLGAHFDTWHAGTGATDNTAGTVVMLEAMRILKAAGVPLRRTVRLALWTGEEQGLLGSRAWVQRHLADRETMTLRPLHGRVSSYFNLDNGTGRIRGVWLQGNAAVRPIFAQWMAPFRGDGMTTLTLANTGGTDHLAFDAVGVPGFQFIQDGVEYDTRTHHSNMDVYERLQPDDLRHNALVVAAFVMQAANRDALLPRKPLPSAVVPARAAAAATTTGR